MVEGNLRVMADAHNDEHFQQGFSNASRILNNFNRHNMQAEQAWNKIVNEKNHFLK